MKKYSIVFLLVIISTMTVGMMSQGQRLLQEEQSYNLSRAFANPIIADHQVVNYVRYDMIPEENITHAKDILHIAYGHTSHGSQIVTGMEGLIAFKESQNGTVGLYAFNNGGAGSALDFDDYFVDGDLGSPDRITWANRTRNFLNDPANAAVNVVMWSWCGQVSSASEEDIDLYLSLMTELEEDFPGIIFVYMTGHTDGSGLEGNLHIRNEQIRTYCLNHNKVLFDFADIESYDPDGNYFGDKYCNDNCDYDSNNDTSQDANWAIEWQNTHPGEWYDCTSAHSQPLNANMKAYAAWWLWATLSGWNTSTLPPTSNPTPPSSNSSTPSLAVGGILATILSFFALIFIKKHFRNRR